MMTTLDDDVRDAAAAIMEEALKDLRFADFRAFLEQHAPFRGLIDYVRGWAEDPDCDLAREVIAAITGRSITGRGQGAALPSSPSAAPCPDVCAKCYGFGLASGCQVCGTKRAGSFRRGAVDPMSEPHQHHPQCAGGCTCPRAAYRRGLLAAAEILRARAIDASGRPNRIESPLLGADAIERRAKEANG